MLKRKNNRRYNKLWIQ